ncbi:MAG: hypothetical protein ABIE07_09715 [Candidatus Zixiibacteriota bacterium]
MKTIKTSIVIICLTIIISIIIPACLGKVTGPDRNFVYPLKVGNYWEYDFSYEHFDSETGEPSLLRPNIYTTSTAEIIGMDTLGDTLETFVFYTEDDTANANSFNSATVYLNNNPDGFYQYANNGVSLIAPAKPSKTNHCYTYIGISFKSVDQLFDFFSPKLYSSSSDNLRRGLAYPFKIGNQWTVVTLGDANPFQRIVKRITNWTKVKTEAGEFDCFKIQWLWDFDGDGLWDDNLVGYDYVSEHGLIVRELRINGTIITDYTGQPIDTCDIVQKFELKKLDLK